MATTPTSGNDNIAGTGAGESISALAGNDNVNAGGGNDTVRGGAGNDDVNGGDGDDRLWGDGGNDTIVGGAGIDFAYFSGNQSQYQITVAGGAAEVKDLRGQGGNTPDGIDQVAGVERLVFADGYRLLVPDRAPVAAGDSAETGEDAATDIAVLGNDTDADGDALSIAALSDADTTTLGNQTASGATISIVGGTVRYDPTGSAQLQALDAGQSAADTFTYTVSDGFGGSATATVAVTVAGATDQKPPVAAADSASTDENTPISIDVLANDSDPNGDALSIVGLADADPNRAGIQTGLGATISVADGKLRYDPTTSAQFQALAPEASLADTLTYTADDGLAGQGTATVRVDVSGALARSFDGETIDYSHESPNRGSVTFNTDISVGPGIELQTSFSYNDYFVLFPEYYSLDITDAKLVFTFPGGGYFENKPFVGIHILDQYNGLSDIVGVTVNPSTTTALYTDISFEFQLYHDRFDSGNIAFDADNIWVNLSNVGYRDSSRIELDVLFA